MVSVGQAIRGRRSVLVFVAVSAAFLGVAFVAHHASGQAIVQGGNLHLGIQAAGQLTVAGGPPSSNCGVAQTSLHFDPSGDEAMDCDFEGEGWGVTYAGGPTGVAYRSAAGTYTNDCGKFGPFDSVSFSSTAATATSVVKIGSMRMTQVYEPFPGVADAYQDHITMTSLKAVGFLDDIRYRRVMSWGSAGAHDDSTRESIGTLPAGGLAPTPVIASNIVSASACPAPGAAFSSLASGPSRTSSAAVVDQGPADTAMVWDFTFGKLGPGKSRTFTLIYGAASDDAQAMADLNAVGAKVYNLVKPDVCQVLCTQAKVDYFMAFGDDLQPKPPTASFAFVVGDGCLDPHVDFTSTATDQDDEIVSWAWDFGDASSATGPAVSHTYAMTQDYPVTLLVKDSTFQASITQTVHGVADTDCPPAITPGHDRIVLQHTAVSYCFEGSDLDTPVLEWQFEGGPAGGNWDSESHCWTWVADRAGRWPFTVTVRDAHNFAATSFTLEVGDGPQHDESIDSDLDGIDDRSDNCPSVPNHEQEDRDRDSVGDACDSLPDTPSPPPTGDPNVAPGQPDADGDGVPDASDNCPATPNRDQTDLDRDHLGDACDDDLDGDGVAQSGPEGSLLDNCPLVPNADQKDRLGNGVGDLCRTSKFTPGCADCLDYGVAAAPQLASSSGLSPATAGLAFAGLVATGLVMFGWWTAQRRRMR